MMYRPVLLVAIALALLSCAAVPAASAGSDVTLLVAPARYSVLQVMFDVLRHRDAVLVSYQGDARSGSPVLHAWNGSEWVPVPLPDFSDASFLAVRPGRAVLIGGDDEVPAALFDAVAWCPAVVSVGSVRTDALVNACGQLFGFSPAEWTWFAKRYGMQLSEAGTGPAKDSWYFHAYREDRIPSLWESVRGALAAPASSPPPAPPSREVPSREVPAPAAVEEMPPPAPVTVDPPADIVPNAMWDPPDEPPVK